MFEITGKALVTAIKETLEKLIKTIRGKDIKDVVQCLVIRFDIDDLSSKTDI